MKYPNLLLLILFGLGTLSLQAQYAGRQGRSDELAEYALHKKAKVSVSRTYVQIADSNGRVDPDEKSLVQVRHFDSDGRVLTDSVYHWEDGELWMANKFFYENGRKVRVEQQMLAGEAPMTNQTYFYYNDAGFMYLQVDHSGSGFKDSTLYHLDAEGNVMYYIRTGHSAVGGDTTTCTNDESGHMIETVQEGNPRMVIQMTYNPMGQVVRVTENMDYQTFGHQELTSRELEYGKRDLIRSIKDFDMLGTLRSIYSAEYQNKKGKLIKN